MRRVDVEKRAEAERLGMQLPEAWTGKKYVERRLPPPAGRHWHPMTAASR
jgi:hypothetical protein